MKEIDERGWQSQSCGWMEEREGEIATARVDGTYTKPRKWAG